MMRKSFKLKICELIQYICRKLDISIAVNIIVHDPDVLIEPKCKDYYLRIERTRKRKVDKRWINQ